MSEFNNILTLDYFEFYGVPVSFFLSEKEIKSKYYEISKKFHPDYFAFDEKKQEEALDISTYNNKAFKTLSSFNSRLEYILRLNNLFNEDEKYELPKAFLMDMMELNEALMDLQMDFEPEKLGQLREQVEKMESELENGIKTLAEEFDTSKGVNFNLLKIKDLYFKLKYILRIKETMSTFAIS